MEKVSAISAWKALSTEARSAVLVMLRKKFQMLALQAFLIRHPASYQTVDLDLLVQMFGLSTARVRSEVNQLIIQGLLSAEWNEDASILLFVAALPSRLDTLAHQLLEKVGELADANARVKDEISGVKRDEVKNVKVRRSVGVLGQRAAVIKRDPKRTPGK